jgi:phage pi2 protein 07
MSSNRNIWTLNLPEEDFVDCRNSIMHYSGIEIANEFLEEEDRTLLSLVGNKIAEFSRTLEDRWYRMDLVHEVNKCRECIKYININPIYKKVLEKELGDTIIYPGFRRDLVINIRYHDHGHVPADAYEIYIEEISE